MKTFTSRRLASFLAAALLAVLPLAHQAAEAGSIGRPSSSSSVSRSAPSRPAAAPSPSRIGGSSKSVGMSRPELMQPSRPVPRSTPAPSYAPRGSATPGYATAPQPITALPAPQAAQIAPREGPGWGTVAAAGLGGALAGHLLTERSHGSTPAAAGVAAAPVAAVPNAVGAGTIGAAAADPLTAAAAPVMAAAQPAYVAVTPQPKDNFATNWIAFCFGIVLLGILALMGFAMWRKSRRPKANASMRPATTYADSDFNVKAMTADLPFTPMTMFWDIQRAHAGADAATLRQLLGPDLVDEMVANATTISPMTLSGVSYVLADDGLESGIITVQYTFYDAGERVIQNWHYIEVAGHWLLNGIDTV